MKRLRGFHRLVGLCALLSAAHGQDASVRVPPPPAALEECDTLALDSPRVADSSLCYFDWASTSAQWNAAALHLRSLLKKFPGHPVLHAALADNRGAKGDFDTMLGSYRLSLEGFQADGNASGEVVARLGLANYYQRMERFEEAGDQLRLAEAASMDGVDALAPVEVEVAQGWLAFRSRDLSRASTKLSTALRRFRTAPADAGPATRRQLRLEAKLANAQGAVYWALVKPDEAIDAYRKEADLLLRLDDAYNATTPLYNLALVAANNQSRLGRTLADVRKETEAALEAALRVGHAKNEMSCRQLLGNLLAGEIKRSGRRDFGPAIKQIEKAMEMSLALHDEPAHNSSMQTLARLYLDQYGDQRKSLQLFDAALSSAIARQNLEQIAWNYSFRFDSLARVGEFDAAVQSGLRALDVIERIRDFQSDPETRVRVFSAWSERYRDIFSALLNPDGTGGDRKSLELAVSVIERMRARELLSDLDRAAATSRLIPEGESAALRASLLKRISRHQADLLSGKLSETERAKLVEEIEDLELDLRRVDQALGQESRKYKLVHAPDFASLEQVRETLDESEVILSYQLQLKTGNLLRITPSSVEWFAVPSRSQLVGPLEFLSGLIRRRDDAESIGAESLHSQLVRQALLGLPATVKRLIVVPDGGLGKLPFGALQAEGSGSRLAERYEVVVAPSLTAWLRWKRARRTPSKRRLLALADPVLPLQDQSGVRGVAEERSWSLARRLSLGRLPRARAEGRSAIRTLAGNGLLAVGRNASEHFIKQIDPGEFSVIHFAVHAIVDETNPERAALLLAPGSDTEDGLLQVREIVRLNLDGQLVVLSACQTASGEVLSGEGVLSLARAFFVAGAHAVVGTLWPVRDDDAAALFDSFYRHLGKGATAAEALAAAQRDRIAEGAPAAAWAGMVLLGNGDLTPFPGGTPEGSDWWPWGALLAAAVTSLLVVLRVRRQERREE